MNSEKYFKYLQQIKEPIDFDRDKSDSDRKRNLDTLKQIREILSYKIDDENISKQREENLNNIKYISMLRKF